MNEKYQREYSPNRVGRLKGYYKKFIDPMVSTRAAGIYLIVFALVIGVATFIENDFGTSAAQKVIFKTWWFELLLLLFGLTILANVFRFQLIRRKRWAVLLFHLSILLILLGAAVTRYLGYEGMMHIRENDQNNTFLSSEMHLKFTVEKDGREVTFDEPVLFASLGENRFNESYLVGDDLIEVKMKKFIPNPVQALLDDENGKSIVQVVLSGDRGREEYFISEGEALTLNGIKFNFTEQWDPIAINIKAEQDTLYVASEDVLTRMTMATQQRDTIYPSSGWQKLQFRSLYSDGLSQFVFSAYNPSGRLEIIPQSIKVKNESLTAALLDISVNGETQEIYVPGKKGLEGSLTPLSFASMDMSVAYGAKRMSLPFAIHLNDFIMERYPGTNSAASFASEIQLIDREKKMTRDYRIFMNNILDHRGYRFFQSSYDADEEGTYLSVNHDFIGTWISYFGYGLFTLGLIASFFNKQGRFQYVVQQIKRLRNERNAALTCIILLFGCTGLFSQKEISPIGNLPVVELTHAKIFSELAVQDFKGRMKPMHTLSRELSRKLFKSEQFHGLNADQVVLSMFGNQSDWAKVPLIKLGTHPSIKEEFNLDGEFASFEEFFREDGQYKLRDAVGEAYNMQPIDRGMREKELLKIDERVNIANMIFKGGMFRIIPSPGDPNNTWLATIPVQTGGIDISKFSSVADQFFVAYQPVLHDAIISGDFKEANQLLVELKQYQFENGGAVMPSDSEIKAEIFLNRLKVFQRLSFYYILVGLGFLALLFLSIFRPGTNVVWLTRILTALLLGGFLFHTLGLGIRWYVSGRAPWSNGYESMIYIAWTTTLAGILLARKSAGGLSATSILAGVILLVAHLSYLDPEITPLVPVLRSYWLTIHVSMVAGSYGFLMLGALIGLINLILMLCLSSNNVQRITHMVKEMSYISEITLIGGLVMLSIGTYLGGIWANESWGRYWGWDAKETWALVTILLYAFILHMRLIPKMKGLYLYNVATLVGWASVIMTYFGVNYYLSGLHSYAAGDPIPIPSWVYIAIGVSILISVLAYQRKRKFSFPA